MFLYYSLDVSTIMLMSDKPNFNTEYQFTLRNKAVLHGGFDSLNVF